MDIQDESPQPENPLADLDADYRHAVLHLAWDRNSDTQERILLFAFVELIPAEIPPPLDDYDPKAAHCSHRLASDSKHYVYVRHAVTTARQGLDWYLASRTGAAVLPGSDGQIPAAESGNAKRLRVADFDEEPPWPTLVSASDDSEAIPFAPHWIDCPRTHHLLPRPALDLDTIWSTNEQDDALHWLEGRLHFELSDYPEYWGSVHLIAPNPVYREIHTRLQRRAPPAESVLFRFQPRVGPRFQGLEMLFRQKDVWGVSAFRRTTLNSPLVRVNFDRAVDAITEDIWDPQRGFLRVMNGARGFLKSIQFDFGLTQRTAVLNSGDPFEVMRSGKPERTVIGDRDKATTGQARAQLLRAHYARRMRRTAEAQDQRWFREQKEEARRLLRSMLNEATRNVLIIDPYFTAEELISTLAVGRYDIPIHILSSAEALKVEAAAGSEFEKGSQLLDVLRKLKTHDRMNPFEIRVMTGSRPAIHDRFLAVDARIWLIGSSLNEFGSRGTMMLALPDPDGVRGDLEKAWSDAEPLEVWVERRQQNRKRVGVEAT